MKRRFLVIIAVVLGLAAMTSACSTSKLERDLMKVISELRLNAYELSNEYMKVNIITGEREEPYMIDGTARDLQQFSVITVTPTNDITTTYTYTLIDGEDEYTGILDPHPFGGQYIADTGHVLSGGAITLTVTNGSGREETVELQPKRTSEMIDHNQAIAEFAAAAGAQIKDMYSGKSIAGELYVRFIIDPISDSGQYFWYVALTNGESTIAVLLDVYSGEVMAERM